jgi:UDP-glucose 4-epimerase
MAAERERVLITGGSGFIGARLARTLIDAGHDVHLVLRSQAQHWRLIELAGRFTVHVADLRDRTALARAVHAVRPEAVYHLATHGAYPFQQDRVEILATNLLGTANLLDALGGDDYRVFVHAGSSSEYGHKDRPMAELDRLEPRTAYAVGKAAASLLCLAEAHRGRPVMVVRVFSAYGPGEEPSRLVPYVMQCCQRGTAPRVSIGRQPRDFVYVDDVVALLQLAGQRPEMRGEVLHAGTGRMSSVREMIETILAVCTNGRLAAEYGTTAPRPDEPVHWVASVARTQALTGWQAQHDLTSGVRRMWQWYQATARSAA